MRIKSAYRYQLFELKKPVIIYYIVIVALLIITAISQTILERHGFNFSYMGGFDGATVIFLFVCGLNAFKQPFHMFLASGISRKTMFWSSVAAFGTVSVGMALLDGIINGIMSSFFRYDSLFAGTFRDRYGIAGGTGITLPMVAEGFVWAIFCYMAAAIVGLFITTAYYRMNKPLKLAISIGIPVMLFIILPIVDSSLFNGAITMGFGRFMSAVTSLLGAGNPYSVVLANAFSIVLFSGLAWLLMRRATVKV